MSKGRLTRQELGWLLTQEAQGAAERLRVGVQVLKTNPPPAELGGHGVDATLDALDDAMKLLSNLHAKPSRVMGRRGRIDLAALLWEVAPDARASIEPGSGTEVHGDEAELRRMLQLLVSHGSGEGSQISIKREGDEVRVGVVLGPDAPSTAETERAWLSRMAVRYGGRLELEGGMEIVVLPADTSDRKEREALERELDEARKQGEAYARELAQQFSPGDEAVSPSTFPPPLAGESVGDRFAALTRFSAGVAAELRAMLVPAARELHASLATDDRLEPVRRALTQVQDFIRELTTVGDLDAQEQAGPVDIATLTRRTLRDNVGHAARSGVDLKAVDIPEKAFGRGAPRAIETLLQMVVAQAILASPRGAAVTVSVTEDERGPRVTVDDAGPPLPAASRRAFIALEIEPGTFGRPTALPLYVAAEIASWQGATFELSDAPIGGVRTSVTFARQ